MSFSATKVCWRWRGVFKEQLRFSGSGVPIGHVIKNKIKWWKCYLAKILMVKSRWTWSRESLWKNSSISPIRVLALCFISSMTSPFQFAAAISKCDIHLSFSLSDLNFCSWRTDESWAMSGMLRWRPHYHKFLSAVVSTCEDVLHAQVGTHYFGRPVCLKAQSCVSWIKRCQFWGSAGVFWPWSAAHGTETWLGLRKPRKGQGDISCWEVGPGKALSHLWNYLSGSYLQCLWDCTF